MLTKVRSEILKKYIVLLHMDISVGNKTTTLRNNNFLEKGWYSITINPDDKHQFFGKADRMQQFRSYVHAGLLFLKTMHIDYHLYLELSEPKTNAKWSKNGPRLHCHGILRFRSTLSIKNFLLMGIYNLTRWCNYDIDTIDSMETWHLYCTKQQHIIKEEPFTNDSSLWKQAEQTNVSA